MCIVININIALCALCFFLHVTFNYAMCPLRTPDQYI